MTLVQYVVEESALVLDTATIRRQADQPRIWFDEEELRLLALSIQQEGQLQPGIVTPVDDPPYKWELVDGERRWRACIMLERSFRAFVKTYGRPIDQFKESCALNFNRADHHPLEIAKAVERLRKEANLSDPDIAKVFGKSQAWVYQHRQLLLLDGKVRALMMPNRPRDKRLKFTHALELVDLPPAKQLEQAERIIQENMTLREVRLKIGGSSRSSKGRKPDARDDFRTLSRFLRNLRVSAEGILEMEAERFNRLLSARSVSERMQIFRQAQGAIEDLQLIAQQVERAGLIGLTPQQRDGKAGRR